MFIEKYRESPDNPDKWVSKILALAFRRLRGESGHTEAVQLSMRDAQAIVAAYDEVAEDAFTKQMVEAIIGGVPISFVSEADRYAQQAMDAQKKLNSSMNAVAGQLQATLYGNQPSQGAQRSQGFFGNLLSQGMK